eukprot:GHRQ01008188.1.p1 GENE.GHRQ01008188.1~~GHRQ01008188.1.p1  ORF type:complete len:120 (+),score=16.16 GHRQ01008188.1:225-584(+)
MARCCPACAAALVLVFACFSLVQSQEPAEYATYRSNLASMLVPGADATVGQALGDALTGWEYTLPLEFVRKGQAYMGPSTRLRRVMSDLMAGTPHPQLLGCLHQAPACKCAAIQDATAF